MTAIFENYQDKGFIHAIDVEWMRINFKPEFAEVFTFISAEYKSDLIFAQE